MVSEAPRPATSRLSIACFTRGWRLLSHLVVSQTAVKSVCSRRIFWACDLDAMRDEIASLAPGLTA